MGRGSSKAGGGGGGAMQQKPPQPTNTEQLPTPEQVAAGDVLPKGGVPFADFEKMTDDEKADVVLDALNTGTPIFLDDSGMQRFAYFTGMNNTPKVVSDSALDAMKGEEIYRTVNNAYNARTDIGFTSTDIAKQISDGDFTMYSDSGGSAYGKAIYFANNYQNSSYYGNHGQNPVTLRAKVTGGKSISYSNASSQYQNALNRGDKLAKACSRAGGGSSSNLYALAKGYDIITDSYSGYRMVLNRRCLTVSSTIKPTNIGGTKW